MHKKSGDLSRTISNNPIKYNKNELDDMQIKLIILENKKEISENFLQKTNNNINVIILNTINSFYLYLKNYNLDVVVSGTDFSDGSLIENKSLIQERTISGFSPGWIVCAKNADPELREELMLSGVDVYLSHPVTPEELTASILRISKRLQAFPRQWQLDVVSWQIIAPNDQVAKLLYREVCLLLALSRHPGIAVKRSELASAMGYSPVNFDPRNMEIMIRRMRKRIREQINYELPVETAHGIGYAFTAPISVMQESHSRKV
jgi:DNA-binding response OmpR family regulator